MSRCERMCMNALAQDGWGYREMSVCLAVVLYERKKNRLTGVHRCCIDALTTLYIFQKNKRVIRYACLFWDVYRSALWLTRESIWVVFAPAGRTSGMPTEEKQVVVFPSSRAVSAGLKCFLLSPRELRKALLKRYCKCSLSSIFTRIPMHF